METEGTPYIPFLQALPFRSPPPGLPASQAHTLLSPSSSEVELPSSMLIHSFNKYLLCTRLTDPGQPTVTPIPPPHPFLLHQVPYHSIRSYKLVKPPSFPRKHLHPHQPGTS